MSSTEMAIKIASVSGKQMYKEVDFSSTEDFQAVDMARELLESEGYCVGSMCRDEPMAAAKGTDYVAKWRNINQSDWPRIEAVIVSKDMRSGPVHVCYFEPRKKGR